VIRTVGHSRIGWHPMDGAGCGVCNLSWLCGPVIRKRGRSVDAQVVDLRGIWRVRIKLLLNCLVHNIEKIATKAAYAT
jgi:hypothetical protein